MHACSRWLALLGAGNKLLGVAVSRIQRYAFYFLISHFSKISVSKFDTLLRMMHGCTNNVFESTEPMSTHFCSFMFLVDSGI